jgi:hypothetical protein
MTVHISNYKWGKGKKLLILMFSLHFMRSEESGSCVSRIACALIVLKKIMKKYSFCLPNLDMHVAACPFHEQTNWGTFLKKNNIVWGRGGHAWPSKMDSRLLLLGAFQGEFFPGETDFPTLQKRFFLACWWNTLATLGWSGKNGTFL